jgi:citrate synthase
VTGDKGGDGGKKPTIFAVDDPDDDKGALKFIGGSLSDNWNHVLADQAVHTIWFGNSDEQARDRQFKATVAALIGIGPRDELEGMLAAQLLASHNAAMECYRRAMIDKQTFEGRRENLSQANKLSRTYAVLLEALNRHRGKGQQKMTVEHVHVHAGGQAIVGAVTPGRG